MPPHCSANFRGAAIPATVRRHATWSATAPRHCTAHPRTAGAPHPQKDGGTLEEATHDYSALARDDAVMSGQWERSPPSPSALCNRPRHRNAIPATASSYPTLWKHATTGRRHANHCASYDLMSTAPSNPHVDGPRTSNLYAPPRSRSWTRIGHATTPRQRQDSLGRPSTPQHCAPCLYT
jgi:hypothetical protein